MISKITKEEKVYDLLKIMHEKMQIGDFEEAEAYSKQVLEIIEDGCRDREIGVFHINKANLLFEQGHIDESLMHYKKGLSLTGYTNGRDHVYGLIWQELAKAASGGKTSLILLLKYRDMAMECRSNYLVSLAGCYYLVASYLLKDYDTETIKEIMSDIVRRKMPEHIALGGIACSLIHMDLIDGVTIRNNILKCNGIKGTPWIIADWVRSSEIADEELLLWIKEHLNPILEYRNEPVIPVFDENIVHNAVNN